MTERHDNTTRARGLRQVAAALILAALLVGACDGDDDDGEGFTDDVESDEGVESERSSSEESAAAQNEAAGGVAQPEPDTLLAIVGDAGELSDDTLAVAGLVDSFNPQAVFTVGDNEYVTEGRTVEAFEESVGGVYGSWIDNGVFYPIPGDHDYGDQCDDSDADADLNAYLSYFDLPVGPEDETYYDVRIGDVHVFTIDSLVDCHRDGGAKIERQREWLEAEATESDAAIKIVLLHNPPYSSGTSHGSFEEFQWDYAAWGIDLVVAGDDHIYERSTRDGVVYAVNGLGGIEAHELDGSIDGSEVLYADAFGAMFVSVGDGRASVSFVTVGGQEIDRFILP